MRPIRDDYEESYEDEVSPFAPMPLKGPNGRRFIVSWEESPFVATEDETETGGWPSEFEEGREVAEEELSGSMDVEGGQFEQDSYETTWEHDHECQDCHEAGEDEEVELDRDLELEEEYDAQAVDQPFVPESLADDRSAAEELEEYEFEGLPGAGNRIVKSARVSCAARDRKLPVFKAIGTEDPVGVLETVCQRAVAMLDNTIAELNRIRARVGAGEPIAFPVVSDLLAWSLENRMLMRIKERQAWTGKGPRTAEQIVRWLSNIRKTITGGYLRFTCLAADCPPGWWAWVRENRYRIHLCRPFWNPKPGVDAATHLEYQAQTIIHEVSHIYYVTEDSGRGPGHAECISQFVADANGSPIDPDFARSCGTAGPVRP